MIREALKNSFNKPARKIHETLYVSDIGFDPAKAMRRIAKQEVPTFSPYVQESFYLGEAIEAELASRLSKIFPRVETQLPLFDKYWDGRADIVTGHNFEDPHTRPTIIEVKTTDPKYWGKYEVVKPFHLLQLWLYGELYDKLYGCKPSLRLYYQAWREWAEYEVSYQNKTFWVKGLMTEDKLEYEVEKPFKIDAPLIKKEAELFLLDYKRNGEIPEPSSAPVFEYVQAFMKLNSTP